MHTEQHIIMHSVIALLRVQLYGSNSTSNK